MSVRAEKRRRRREQRRADLGAERFARELADRGVTAAVPVTDGERGVMVWVHSSVSDATAARFRAEAERTAGAAVVETRALVLVVPDTSGAAAGDVEGQLAAVLLAAALTEEARRGG